MIFHLWVALHKDQSHNQGVLWPLLLLEDTQIFLKRQRIAHVLLSGELTIIKTMLLSYDK